MYPGGSRTPLKRKVTNEVVSRFGEVMPGKHLPRGDQPGLLDGKPGGGVAGERKVPGLGNAPRAAATRSVSERHPGVRGVGVATEAAADEPTGPVVHGQDDSDLRSEE